MNIKLLILFLLTIFSTSIFSRSMFIANGVNMISLNNSNLSTDTGKLAKSKPLIKTLPFYWKKQTALTNLMPYGIEIYRSKTDYTYHGGPIRKINAYCVVVDPKYVEFKPTYSKTNKIPIDFIKAEPGNVLVCINAGFFGSNVAYSMLKYADTTYASNPNILNRTYNGKSVQYFTTRAAFGLSAAFTPSVTWTYQILGKVYSYEAPNPNDINHAPQLQPTSAGRLVWNTVTAIGGSPMLVKNGRVNLTDAEELIVIDNYTARARTGIGYTANGKIILLAVEGNNKSFSDGLTLVELANYMKDMGCIGAVNLDGGSSTFLRVNGQEMIRPSSGGTERAMPSVILIKSKK